MRFTKLLFDYYVTFVSALVCWVANIWNETEAETGKDRGRHERAHTQGCMEWYLQV
jgi:hypothetical protein